jgi:hypothetical protein
MLADFGRYRADGRPIAVEAQGCCAEPQIASAVVAAPQCQKVKLGLEIWISSQRKAQYWL